ncbi:MAG: hypothetical protein R3C45_18110 [Phycisphaerales bacterium]
MSVVGRATSVTLTQHTVVDPHTPITSLCQSFSSPIGKRSKRSWKKKNSHQERHRRMAVISPIALIRHQNRAQDEQPRPRADLQQDLKRSPAALLSINAKLAAITISSTVNTPGTDQLFSSASGRTKR